MATLAEFVVDTVKRYHTAFTNKRILKTAEEVSANTNEDNLPSAVVVGELYNKLTLQLPDDLMLTAEGDGSETKYYIQRGADTASKKRLGSSDFEILQFGFGFSYTVPHDGMLCINWSFGRGQYDASGTSSSVLYHNGTTLSSKSGSTPFTHTFKDCIEVKKGDVIQVTASNTGGTTNSTALCLLY